MAWFGRRAGTDEPTLKQLRGWHLVLLPATVDVAQVDRLVRSRYPDSRLADTRKARLGRHAALSGPHEIEPDELRDVQVPEGWSVAYALEVESTPDPQAFEDIGDPELRAWWMRAFPLGKPFRDEGDAVDLGLALARRLGGALRAAGSGVLLEPDHDRVLDLTIWSGFWLDPDRLLELLEPVLPGAHVDLTVPGRHAAPHHDTPWSVHPLDPLGADLAHALGDPDRELIEAVAAQHDAHALEGGVVLDGYALTALGSLVVEVIQEDAVPSWVRERVSRQLLAATNPVVTYSVRWVTHDPHLLESEDPPYAVRLERERVKPRMRAAALTLAEATAGVVTDSDGFEVDRYSL
ncbi:hypothetical protein ACPPVT_01120 [Angustibacter sp. McL0619]|uniref:hypothetical protein n=1 Tax=Angustibacter sp. McL0619 TaxID=3415676 RepID=UPI003CEB3BA1